jgi:hypothetical protein
MWPWSHLALGYLLYTFYLRVRGDGLPSGRPVLFLAFGTQLPDLVDKPLAWYLHVLPYGRTLMHSVLLGGVVVAVAALYLRREGYAAEGTALALGYGSHLVGDSYRQALSGDWANLAFLVWPVFPIPGAESEVEGLLTHLRGIDGSPFFLFGLLLAGVAFALWASHGWPGWTELRERARRGAPK